MGFVTNAGVGETADLTKGFLLKGGTHLRFRGPCLHLPTALPALVFGFVIKCQNVQTLLLGLHLSVAVFVVYLLSFWLLGGGGNAENRWELGHLPNLTPGCPGCTSVQDVWQHIRWLTFIVWTAPCSRSGI